jgi:hypothetical protein
LKLLVNDEIGLLNVHFHFLVGRVG